MATPVDDRPLPTASRPPPPPAERPAALTIHVSRTHVTILAALLFLVALIVAVAASAIGGRLYVQPRDGQPAAPSYRLPAYQAPA
jgi:hypothetical protein